MTTEYDTRPPAGDPYRPPVHLAPPPTRPRRNWLGRVEPFYRAMIGGTLGLLAAAAAARAYGITGWLPALLTAFAAPATAVVIGWMGWNRRGQIEGAVLAGLAGGWLTFVTAAGWDPHAHGVPFAPFVPAGALFIGLVAMASRAEHRAKVTERAMAARAAGPAEAGNVGATNISRPAPAEPKPARPPRRPPQPQPDETLITRIAAESGIKDAGEVRVIWAHVTGYGNITASVAGDLIAALPGFTGNPDADHSSTGQRRLAAMERAGWLKKDGRPGNQEFVPGRGNGLLHRVK